MLATAAVTGGGCCEATKGPGTPQVYCLCQSNLVARFYSDLHSGTIRASIKIKCSSKGKDKGSSCLKDFELQGSHMCSTIALRSKPCSLVTFGKDGTSELDQWRDGGSAKGGEQEGGVTSTTRHKSENMVASAQRAEQKKK